jgi:phenylacetate-coenzyme A ligase PaaK-like adenylate-forming protein
VPGLKEYNIQQLALDHLNFDLVIDKNYPIEEGNLSKELLSLVNKYLQANIKVTFKIVDKLDRTKSGKAKHFVSLIE